MIAEVNNCKMYYEVTGNENRPWLILIHGISGSTRCWKYQIDDFNKHFKVLNLDLPGHGNSEAMLAERYNGTIIANQIRLLMDKLGIEKAYIVGLSLGTIIQQYFCELFPERVIAMIYAGPISKPNYLSRIFNGFADKVFLKLFTKNAYLKLMANLMLPGKAHEKSRKFFLEETLKMNDLEFIKWWKVTVQGDHYYYIKQTDVPALIIAGEKDFCFFKDAVALKQKYNNSDFRVIKGAGHVFIFQKPKEFNEVVIEYILSMEDGKQDCIKESVIDKDKKHRSRIA